MKFKVPLLFATVAIATTVFFYACSKDAKSEFKNSGSNSLTNTAGAKTTRTDQVSLSCYSSTQTSITLTVTAGSVTGAPAGFSIQWMTKSDFDALNDVWPSDTTAFCKASFSGNANLSRYNLKAGESVQVNIGEFLFDNGASTNCDGSLLCGTDYVFRAFAHANSTLFRSDFSFGSCSTSPCGTTGICTYTQGYWKTHGIVPKGNNEYVWPQDVKDNGLTVGTVSTPYTPQQLLNIFNTPAGGNGLIALAHQLIAAKLNVLHGSGTTIDVTVNGTNYTDINALIAAVDTFIGNKVIPPVGSGYIKPADASPFTSALGKYNEGGTGPGHCE